MSDDDKKQLSDLIWEYFQKGSGGLRADNLMNKLLELNQTEMAMRLLEIEALDLISVRLARLIEVLERSAP